MLVLVELLRQILELAAAAEQVSAQPMVGVLAVSVVLES